MLQSVLLAGLGPPRPAVEPSFAEKLGGPPKGDFLEHWNIVCKNLNLMNVGERELGTLEMQKNGELCSARSANCGGILCRVDPL